MITDLEHRIGQGRGLVRPARQAETVTSSPGLDRDALNHIFGKQDLVMSRAQAAGCGMTRAALRYRTRPGGPWQELLPGIYLAVTGSPTLAQKETATALYAGQYGVLTGMAALRRHGLKVPETPAITVLSPASQARQSRAFASVWPTVRMPVYVCYSGVVQYALPDRAAADAARELGDFREARAVIANAIQQGRCRLDRLEEELAHGPVRGSARLRRCLMEVSKGIRSGAEGDFGDLLRSSRLPVPMFNARLFAGKTFIAIADAWWPDAGVAAEVDSREWHLSPGDWENTLRRHSRMSAHGIIVLHFTPNQIRHERARVAADIKSALAAGRARPRVAVRALPAQG